MLVAAGTYNSAKLMMLSGIGPADHLDDFQILVIADLPGVGSNLMDHHEVPIIATTKGKSGYFGQDRGWPMIRNGLQYLLFNSGPVTTTGIEACLFYDPDGGDRPTIQLYCAPIVYQDRDVSKARPTWGVTFTSCLLRPKARGTVRLRSADPAAQPLVDPNFFRRLRGSAAHLALDAPRPAPARNRAVPVQDQGRDPAGARTSPISPA